MKRLSCSVLMLLLVAVFPNMAHATGVLTFTESTQPSPPLPGQEVTVSIRWTHSMGNCRGGTLTMSYPAGLTYRGATPSSSTVTSNQVTWHFPATLGGGHSGSFSATFLVSNSFGSTLNLPLSYTQPPIGNQCSINGLSSSISVPVAAHPELTLSKTASVSQVAQSGPVTWTLSFENKGNTDATNVVLTDTLPAGFTFGSASGGGTHSGGSPGGTVTWNLGTVLHGTKGSVTVQGTATTASGILTNSAQITAPNCLCPSSPATANVVIAQQPDLHLEKTASSKVQAGGQITYSLHYENRGNAAATSAVITDTLPSNLAPLIIVGGSASGNVITWNLGNLAPHSSGTVTYTALVLSSPADGDPIVNSATLVATGTPSTSSSSVPVYVYEEPTIELEKVGPVSAEAGSYITYQINYRNTGFGTATGVVLDDALPTTCTNASAGGAVNVSGNTWRWTIGSLPPLSGGSVLISCQIQSGLANGTILVNNADISSSNAFPVHKTFQTVVRSHPELVVTKQAITPSVTAGGPLEYVVEIRNIGNGNAAGVTLADHLDPNVTYVSASQGGTLNAGVVTWSIGGLAPGEGTSRVLYLLASPLSSGSTIQNYATLTSTQTSPLTSLPALVTVQSEPVLEITKKALTSSAQAGGKISYEITVSNTGNAPATQVALTDLLPDIAQFTDATGGYVYSSSARTVTWNLGTLTAGSSSTTTLTVTVNNGVTNGTPILNSVTVASNELPPQSTHVLTPITSQTRFELSKRVLSTGGGGSGTDVVNAGGTLTYELSFSNTGNQDASQVVVTDNLPGHVQFGSASGNGVYDAATRTVTWNIGDLPAGQTGTVQLSLTVDSPLADGTQLINGATINSPQASTTSQVITHVSSRPRLAIVKEASPQGTVAAGSQIAYRLSYSNTGTDIAQSAQLVDTLPDFFGGAAPVILSGGGTYDSSTRTVTWNLGDIAVGGTGSRDLVMQVPNGSVNGTSFTNLVSLSATNAPAVNTVVTNTVGSTPTLTTTLTVDRPIAPAGATLTYTANVQNIGNATANGVIVEIPIPAGTTYLSNTAGGTIVGNTLQVNIGNLSSGAGRSFLIYARILTPSVNGTVIPALSSASSTNAPTVTASTSTQVISAPLLGLTKVAQSQVKAGGLLLYSLQYRNDGSDAATQVVLQDTLPPGTQFVSAGSGGTYSNGVVTWNLGTVSAGASGSVLLQLRANTPLANGTLLVNKASIASQENPPVAASGSTIVASAPILQVEKIAGSSPVQAGGSVLFTLKYANTGNDTAHNVQMVDQLPPGGFPSIYSSPATYDSTAGTLTWSMGDLAPGASGELYVTVLFPNNLNDGLVLNNGAILSASNAPTQTMQIPVLIGSAANMRVDLTSSQTTVSACQTIEYVLDIQNIGNAVAQNIPVQVPVPAHATFVSATGGGALSNGVVTWTLPELTAGSGLNLRVTFRIDCATPNGAQIVSTAVVTPINGTSKTSQSMITVTNRQPPASPTISKVFNQTTIKPGGTSMITFTLSNPNSSPLTGASFTDVLSQMSVSGSQSAGGTCNGANSNQFDDGDTLLALTGLNLPISGSCTVTILVTSSTVGVHPNTASGVTTIQTPAPGAVSNTVSLNVTNEPTPPIPPPNPIPTLADWARLTLMLMMLGVVTWRLRAGFNR